MLPHKDLFSLSHGDLFSLKVFLVDFTWTSFSNQAGWMKLHILENQKAHG